MRGFAQFGEQQIGCIAHAILAEGADFIGQRVKARVQGNQFGAGVVGFKGARQAAAVFRQGHLGIIAASECIEKTDVATCCASGLPLRSGSALIWPLCALPGPAG